MIQKYKVVVDIGSRHLKAVKARQIAKAKFQVDSYQISDAQQEDMFKSDLYGGVEVPTTFARAMAELVRSEFCWVRS